MIARVFVYSRMWECGKCWYRATEKPNRTVNRNLGSKPIETDRKRKIPHRNNTTAFETSRRTKSLVSRICRNDTVNKIKKYISKVSVGFVKCHE